MKVNNNNDVYIAHFDAGYHENIAKYSLSFIIIKEDKIIDVFTDKFLLSVRNKGKDADYKFVSKLEELNKIIRDLSKFLQEDSTFFKVEMNCI